MLLYTELIFKTNKKFNITGIKCVEEIAKTLIIGSIDPFRKKNVPRGTFFADIGSGAGIPGIPFAIFFEKTKGVLIESNRKKADFIQSVIKDLKIENISVICERAEDVARKASYRESFSLCLARAFAHLYVTLEIGSSFLEHGGSLYVYSNDSKISLSEDVLTHAENLGVRLLSSSESEDYGISSGMLFKKESKSCDRYPRRFAVIKRSIKDKEV